MDELKKARESKRIKLKSKKAIQAKKNLEKYAKSIDKHLENYLNQEINKAFNVSPKEKILATHLLNHIKEHSLRPAKRLRASFIDCGYTILGGKNRKKIIPAATGIELIHTALLIHDDVMDQDDTRRGLPATHEYYKLYHRHKNFRHDSDHYGVSMAIDAGDLALCLGFELIGSCKFDSSKSISTLKRTLRGITNTAHGQAFDITLEAEGSAKEKDVLDLHHAKTAIYTYENPLHIGAIFAGAKESDLEILSKYATAGGVAFQLQDDILGLFGDPKKTGKPAHSDLRQGKITLLIIKSLEKSNNNQKYIINSIWGKHNLTEKDAERVREVVVDTGSLDYSKKLATKWAKKAQDVISLMQEKRWEKGSIEYLDGITQYMIEREF